jgi:hypothetical protein
VAARFAHQKREIVVLGREMGMFFLFFGFGVLRAASGSD